MATDNNTASNGAAAAPLLRDRDFRVLLGVGARTFAAMRSAGIVPLPLDLGPRTPRWTYQDYLATVAKLPRRERAPEPATLAQGRRARIERLRQTVPEPEGA
jgi:hypothetical protein